MFHVEQNNNARKEQAEKTLAFNKLVLISNAMDMLEENLIEPTREEVEKLLGFEISVLEFKKAGELSNDLS